MKNINVIWLAFLLMLGSIGGFFNSGIGDVKALTWTQTDQVDFETGLNKTNVDWTSDPGNVTLVPSPTDWIKGQGNPVLKRGPLGSWDYNAILPGSIIIEDGVYKMWFAGQDGSNIRIGYAESLDGLNWIKYNENPVLNIGTAGEFDETEADSPTVIKDGNLYKMWYHGVNGSEASIGYAWSNDGINWTKYPFNPVLIPEGGWEGNKVRSPHVLNDSGTLRMWYQGHDGTNNRIGYAESSDGIIWTKSGANPIFDLGSLGNWDDSHVADPCVIKESSTYKMWYAGITNSNFHWQLGYAESLDGINWNRYAGNPVLSYGNAGDWDSEHVSPLYVLWDASYYRLWFYGTTTALGNLGDIGHARSDDGINWAKRGINPVIDVGPAASWEASHAYSPSVVKQSGIYHMWYSGEPSGFVPAQIGHATSIDGYTWIKDSNNPVVPVQAWFNQVSWASVLWDEIDGEFKMWFTGYDPISKIGYANSTDGSTWMVYPTPVFTSTQAWEAGNVHGPYVAGNISSGFEMWYAGSATPYAIGHAESPDGITWTSYTDNPVLQATEPWESGIVRDPTVHISSTGYAMWYRGGSSIGIAFSDDGINWTKSALNPVLVAGASGSWDDNSVQAPEVIKDGVSYKMWYSGNDGSIYRIGYATAAYGSRFMKEPSNPVLKRGPVGLFDNPGVGWPYLMFENGKYRMWYTSGTPGSLNNEIGYAESADGIVWEKHTGNPVIRRDRPWDSGPGDACCASVLNDTDFGEYRLWYAAWPGNSSGGPWRIAYANSTDGINWTKPSANPIVLPIGPEDQQGYPRVIKDGVNDYKMWYGCRIGGNWQICYATSTDGFIWTKSPSNPVIPVVPATWEDQATSDPWVVNDSGIYKMWYRGWGGYAQIGYATSIDGEIWTKYPISPIMMPSSFGEWDSPNLAGVAVAKENMIYRMWYTGGTTGTYQIGHAISSDGINWTKRAVNPVVSEGFAGDWDDYNAGNQFVMREGSTYKMWYTAANASTYPNWRIGYADSVDGVDWSKRAVPVLTADPSYLWESGLVEAPSVLKKDGIYRMWYGGAITATDTNTKVGYATSLDGINWTRVVDHAVLDKGEPGAWDSNRVSNPTVIYDEGVYKMWYDGNINPGDKCSIGYAYSTDGINWTKHSSNPVLSPGLSGSWDSFGVGGAHVEKTGLLYLMWYHGMDVSPAPGIGFAMSLDGVNWTRSGLNPILWKGSTGSWEQYGIAWPSVVVDSGSAMMFYVGAVASSSKDRIGLATSNHLSIGTYVSTVFDSGGGGTNWNATFFFNATLPFNTLISFATRTSEDNSTWSPWSNEIITSGSPIESPRGRYIQYRATLVSLDAKDTPILHDVTISYELNAATAPTLISPADGSWTNDSMPTFTWAFNDPEGDTQYAFNVSIDNETSFGSVDCTSEDVVSPTSLWTSTCPPLGDGQWYWHVKTNDGYNWSANSTYFTLNIDTIPPTTSISYGAPNYSVAPVYVTSSTLFTLSADDGTGSGINSIWYKIDMAGTWTEYTAPFTVGMEGPHNIYYNSTDQVANSETPNPLDIYVDDTAPTTTLSVGVPSYIVDGNYYVTSSTQFILSAVDGGSGINSTWYKIDLSGSWIRYVSPFDLSGYSGMRTIFYNSSDNVENSEIPNDFSIFVDSDSPHTFITVLDPNYGTNPVYVNSSTEFNLTAIDSTGIDSIWYKVDAIGTWIQYTDNFKVTTGGIHTIYYNSTDDLENIEPANTLNIYVDETPPITTINVHGAQYAIGAVTYVTPNTVLSFSADDSSGSGIAITKFRIDGGIWTLYMLPFSINVSGTHTIEFNSTDNLGNAEATSSLDIFVDDAVPASNIAIGTPNATVYNVIYVNSSTKFTLIADDGTGVGVDAIYFQIDDSSWQIYNSPITLGDFNLDSGFRTIGYYSIDYLGNTEIANYIVVFLDDDAPIANAGPDITIEEDNSVILNGLRSTDIGIIVNYTWTFTLEGENITLYGGVPTCTFENPGTVVITLTVRDALGLDGSDTIAVIITDDLDEDNDGLPDSWEIHYFGNLDQTAYGDPDNDGAINYQEWVKETDPTMPDKEEQPLEFPWWIFLVIIIIIEFIIMLLLFWRRKTPEELEKDEEVEGVVAEEAEIISRTEESLKESKEEDQGE